MLDQEFYFEIKTPCTRTLILAVKTSNLEEARNIIKDNVINSGWDDNVEVVEDYTDPEYELMETRELSEKEFMEEWG
jgi:hypothetical protein